MQKRQVSHKHIHETPYKSLPLMLFPFLFLGQLNGQSETGILFILDGSGSMWGQIEGDTKTSIANRVLNETLSHFDTNKDVL